MTHFLLRPWDVHAILSLVPVATCLLSLLKGYDFSLRRLSFSTYQSLQKRKLTEPESGAEASSRHAKRPKLPLNMGTDPAQTGAVYEVR